LPPAVVLLRGERGVVPSAVPASCVVVPVVPAVADVVPAPLVDAPLRVLMFALLLRQALSS